MHASSVLNHTAVLHEMYKSNAKVGASEQMLTYCGVCEYTSDLFLRSPHEHVCKHQFGGV